LIAGPRAVLSGLDSRSLAIGVEGTRLVSAGFRLVVEGAFLPLPRSLRSARRSCQPQFDF